MLHSRACRIAGVLLLLSGGVAHAFDEQTHVVVTATQPAKAKKAKTAKSAPVKKIAQRVIALPSEIAGLLFGHSFNATTFDWRQAQVAWAGESQANWNHLRSDLLPVTHVAPDTVELNLSETRVAVWLRDDLNVHCDLEQDPMIARGDQFAVKLGLQFRFR